MTDTMLKLMIVDDENLVRDLFKRCLDWEMLGFRIAGEAAGAREALELIAQEIPDVLFTDICMPYMDGIELSRIVREKYPWIKIVILTGHEEFDYAKRSIQAGVAEFLLKPIHNQEIQKVVTDLKGQILTERAEREEHLRLKYQLTDNLPYLREKIFNELLQNESLSSGAREKLDYFNIRFIEGHFQVAIVEITSENSTGPEDQLFLGMEGVDLARAYYGKNPQIHIFFDFQQRMVVLNNDPAVDIAELAESMKIMMQNQLECYITIGIGNQYPGLGNIHDSYREAVEALNYKLVLGKDQIISYRDLDLLPRNGPPSVYQSGEFAFFIKAGCREKAADWLETFFTVLGADPALSVDSLRAKALMIVAALLSTLDGLGLRFSDIYPQTDTLYDRIFHSDTLPEIRGFLKDLVLTGTTAIKTLHEKKERSITKEVQDYLIHNLANEDLSLTGVAKVFYLNPSYLSRVFKQGTGMTFVEFLTKIRMETAMKLLREADQKAYQIGEAVGIPDPHYFGFCFKKYTGMSIHEFRKA